MDKKLIGEWKIRLFESLVIMIRTKRLFYTPGLISLIGLSFALPYFYKKNSPVKYGVLHLFVPKDRNKDYEINHFTIGYLEKEIRYKKKISVTINENHEENRKKLDIIRTEALKLKYFEDTSTVVLIKLSDSITYGEFISIVDMCESDSHKRYGCWNNQYVIWGQWPAIKIKENNIITPLYCGNVFFKKSEQKIGFFNSVFIKVKNIYTPQGLSLSLGFLALTLCFFIKIRLGN